MSDNNQIDYAAFADTTLSEQDLKDLVTGRVKYQNDGWYRFRCTAATQGVTKPTDEKGNPKATPSGSRWVRRTWVPLRPDGTPGIHAPEIEDYFTLFGRTSPQLLKLVGYTDEQIAYVASQPLKAATYDKNRDYFAAVQPETFRAVKDEATGKWNMTQEEVRQKVLQAQAEAYANPKLFIGHEILASVHVKIENNFARAEIGWVRGITDPPKDKDGTFKPILDPDAK